VLHKELNKIDALGRITTCKTFHIVLKQDMSVTGQKYKFDSFWVDLEQLNDRRYGRRAVVDGRYAISLQFDSRSGYTSMAL
jgi:hypothetical protein